MHDPVRGAFNALYLQVAHIVAQTVEQGRGQCAVLHAPDHQGRQVDAQQLAWKGYRSSRRVIGSGWAQRRCAVVVQGACQTALPNGAVLRLDGINQPRRRAVVARLLRKKSPEPVVTISFKLFFCVGSNQKVHVGASGLLGGRVLQLAQKSTGVR